MNSGSFVRQICCVGRDVKEVFVLVIYNERGCSLRIQAGRT